MNGKQYKLSILPLFEDDLEVRRILYSRRDMRNLLQKIFASFRAKIGSSRFFEKPLDFCFRMRYNIDRQY